MQEEQSFIAVLAAVVGVALWNALYFSVIVLAGGVMVGTGLWCIDRLMGTSMSSQWSDFLSRVEGWFTGEGGGLIIVEDGKSEAAAPAEEPKVEAKPTKAKAA